MTETRNTGPITARALDSISRPSSEVRGTAGSGYVDSRNWAMGAESMM